MKKVAVRIKAKHETHRHVWGKFALVLGVFLLYFLLISLKYGVKEGFFVSWLTWSFFVLCTPIADAGFLLDFPLRLILKVRMLHAEIFVWVVAISLNITAYFLSPMIYEKTKILYFFKHIIEEPFPMWSIIALSGLGTFLSIQFADELLDVMKHKDRNYHQKHSFKHRAVVLVFIFALIFVLYDFVLKKMGVDIL
ncbi:hypothetical protein ACFL08_02255 [Patescibacteria group bacterium]